MAAVNVTRDGASGAIAIRGSAGADHVDVIRTGAQLIVQGRSDTIIASPDASCTNVSESSAVFSCAAAGTPRVDVRLGAGADSLDAREATRVRLTVRGAAGTDTLRVGASGTVRVEDASSKDVIDMSHAGAAVRVRYNTKVRRVVATCSCAEGRFRLELPTQPGRVLLGSAGDDVDLRGWRRSGVTRWSLGEGGDQFLGSPRRRSIVDGGGGADKLVSFAARDTLRGGASYDRIADLGGSGDILDGGADMDFLVSLDRRRDTLKGGAGRDVCYSTNRFVSGCGAGAKRSIEHSHYMPIHTTAQVFRTFAINAKP